MITPISLEHDVEVTKRQLGMVKKVGAGRFHIDIIDGLYADNLTVTPGELLNLDFAEVEIDLHLLVEEPIDWLEEAAAVKPTRIFAQIEKMGDIEKYIAAAREWEGIKVGLGVGIYTPVSSLEDKVLTQVDGVILMAIEAGFGGSPFHPEVIDKIKELRARWEGQIVIDGGINPETYKQVMSAGASEAGANSALWKGDFEENWATFDEARVR